MTGSQRSFLEREFGQLTIAAGLQRSSTYLPTATDAARTAFRNSLRAELATSAERYGVPVSDLEHVSVLRGLVRTMSEQHRDVLVDGRFRVGVAQKCLNLYLKYLWCAGWITTPPHCPFDAVIMRRLPPRSRVAWTRLDSIDGYTNLVAAAKAVADGQPLAEWELEEYASLTTVAT